MHQQLNLHFTFEKEEISKIALGIEIKTVCIGKNVNGLSENLFEGTI